MKNIFSLYHVHMVLLLLHVPPLLSHTLWHDRPRLTVIIVVDQLSHRLLHKATPHLTSGLKFLLQKGAVYTNAYYPHAIPLTATGHTALNTGVYACDHGIVGNSWFNDELQEVNSDDDCACCSAVLNPQGTHYAYGKSPRNIMIDGLSDQFMLDNGSCSENHVYALSLKSRAAIAMANKLGKALWFDDQTGMFTSSSYYFSELPAWVKEFNECNAGAGNLDNLWWNRAKPRPCHAYTYGLFSYYAFNECEHLLNKPIHINHARKRPFHDFMITPPSMKILFDLGRACIDEYICPKQNRNLILWISISSIDLLGHECGQESEAGIDLLYHLDKYLKPFIRHAQRAAGKKNTLFILTSDHAVKPILGPDAKNLVQLQRFSAKQLIDALNEYLLDIHGVANLAYRHYNSQIYFNRPVFNTLPCATQEQIVADALVFLRSHAAIKNAWSYFDLCNGSSSLLTGITENYIRQMYCGRSGEIVVQPYPYVDITDHQYGTNHTSPYEYDTHVPLIVYQRTRIELKTIHDRVSTLQIPVTIAEILGIPKPSGALSSILPGIYPRRKYLVC